MPTPDMSAALGSDAPATADAPFTDPEGGPDDASEDSPELDPEFSADASELFPKFSSAQLAKLQSLIDARCQAASGGAASPYSPATVPGGSGPQL